MEGNGATTNGVSITCQIEERKERKKTTTTHDAPLSFLRRFLVLEIETHPHFIHTHTNIDRERERMRWTRSTSIMLHCEEVHRAREARSA